MATRDETLRLQFEVEGIGNLRDLRTQIDALGEQGQQSASELSQLTDALANTGALQQSLARLRELGQQYVGLQQRIRETQAATIALDAASKQAAATQGATRAAIAEQEQGLLRLAAAAQRGEISEEQRQRASAEARTEIQRLTAELREAETAQRRYDAELEKSRGTISKLAAQQDRLREPIQQIRGELEKAGVASKSYTGAQAELQARAQQSRAALEALAGTVSQQVAANRAAAVSVQQLADANQTLGRRGFGDISAEIAKVRAAYETLSASGTLSTRELSQAQSRLIERTRELRAEYGSLGNSLQQVQGSLIAAGASLFTVTRLLSNAAAAASQFQRSLAAISTIAPQADLASLGDSVRALTREFGGDAARNAAALYEIIAAGVEDTTQALQILRVANQLAIGGLADTEVAASGLVATLNAYGLAADQATRVSDAFFVSAAAGNTTIEELSQSIGGVAPLAASVGVSIEQLTSAVGALTAGGLDTGQAFTQIQSALTAVVKPTAEAQKAAEALGIQFDVAALRSQGLQQFLQGVSEAAQGNETTLATLFGRVEGLQGVLALTGNQADAFAKALSDMEQGAGRTAEALAKLQDTPEQRLQLFRAAVGDLQISFGQAVTALTPLLDNLTSAVNLFNELPAGVRTGIAGLTALTAVVAPLAIAIVQSRAALVLLLGSLRAIGPAAAAAAAGTTALGRSIALLAGPVGIVVAGFGALAAAMLASKAAAEERLATERQGIQSLREYNDSLQERIEKEELLKRAQAEGRDEVQQTAVENLRAATAELVEVEERLRVAREQALSQSGLLGGSTLALERRQSELRDTIKQASAEFERQGALLVKQRGVYGAFEQVIGNLPGKLKQVAQSLNEIASDDQKSPAKLLEDQFRKASAEADGLAGAISNIFKEANFEKDAEKIGAVSVALAAVAEDSEETARVVRETLAAELGKLSGTDLLRFQQAAQFAFDQVGRSSDKAAASLSGTFEQAIRRLGVSFEAAGIGISEEGGNIIATFQTLAQSGLANANAIEQGFTNALAKVSTSAEVKALGDALASAAARGQISAQQYDQTLKLIQQRLAQIQNEALGTEPPPPPPKETTDGYQRLASAATEVGKGAEEAAKGIEKANEKAAVGGGFAGVYADALLALRKEFQQTSQAAVDLFIGYQKLAARGGAGSDLLGLLDQLAGAGELTRRQLAASKSAAEQLANSLSGVSSATDLAAFAASDFGARFAGSTAGATEEIARLLAEIDAVERGVGNAATGLQFLDKATLENLKRQAEGAAQSIRAIENAARAAQEQLDALERKQLDEADRAAGNEEAVRRRQFEDELRRIDELAAASGSSAQQQAERLRRAAEEALKRDLQQIRQKEREQIDSDNRVRENRDRPSGSTQQGGGGGIDRQRPESEPRAPLADPRATSDRPPVTINFNGPTLGTPEDLARELRREFSKLDRIGNNPRR